VPQSLEKRLEIMSAIRTLTAPDADEQVRKREADIAALRRNLERIRQDVLDLWCQCEPRSYVIKYSPDQPRVPAGNPDGGEWTSEGAGDHANDASDPADDGEATIVTAARQNQAECDEQYKLDIFKCNLVRTPLCYATAMERYAACLAGRPIPQLRF
jgi:hypothetical protein